MAEGTAEPVELEWYVNAVGDTDALAVACKAEAKVLVDHHIGGGTVPDEIKARAVLEVGADLFYRRAARNGVVNFGSGIEQAAVVRINRDPMTQAYALLAPFLPMGFA